jgi:photosystem II stability/assembly factor-like uncharacterized protein
VISRAFLGACAALSLAAACPAHAAVQVSQSGWQWGNPTPQGNTIRAMDFVAGRGYAIGDDGTALRTDDGGATWTGLATGTSQDLTRLQAVTPDVVVVLGGDGCVVRRSDDGGRTFHKMFVLAEVGCPDRVAAAYFVSPQVGYLLLRDGNVLRTTDGGETFGRGTAIPGTEASAGGGRAVPADAIFTDAASGLVFLAGGTTAFRTTDAGASWTPEPDVPAGNVQRLRVVDPVTFYAFGPGTLLRCTDAGQTWQARAVGTSNSVTGIGCATVDVCLMTVDRGANLLRTENGGETAEAITASTSPLFAAGFANPARAIAAGAGGATAVSNDGGRNYVPVGGDIAGSFQFGLRPGPTDQIALALGARGQLARTTDNGTTWKAINVATSADMRDTSFSTADNGYALDQRGGLFRTANGGQSWQPIDPGTTSAPRAVITAGDVVLLAGPRGVRRATSGGEFSLAARPARTAAVDQFDRAGSAIIAYGSTAIVRTTNGGRSWTTIRGPKSGKRALRLRDVDMTSRSSGFALDTNGRVWRTTNGGRRWTEVTGVGTDDGLSLAFGSPSSGFLTLERYPADADVAYVLRTTDSGRHWRPQRVASGEFPGTEGVISPSASRSYALTSTPAAGSGFYRSLFTTASGGDAGSASSLSLTTSRKRFTRAQFRRANRRITVSGALRGAQGGEAIVVSARSVGSTRWTESVVTAGANGGRFTESFRVSGSAEFVARWAGDSGRQGAGSTVLKVTVR